MTVNILGIVQALKPELIDQMIERRNNGESFEVIAAWLSPEIGHRVGRESVRKWIAARDAAALEQKPKRSKVVVGKPLKGVTNADGSTTILGPGESVVVPQDGVTITEEIHAHRYLERGNGTAACSCGDIISAV